MSSYIYDSWSIEETENIGQKFKARCKANYGYENTLKVGEIYEIEITPHILPMSPLCKGVGINNKKFECHLTRFEKVEKL